jgi:hypothetical protein
MQAMGDFSTSEIAEMEDLVGSLTGEQVVLLVRLYCLMREMAEQDARVLAVESSETLARLRRAIGRSPSPSTRLESKATEAATGCRSKSPRDFPRPRLSNDNDTMYGCRSDNVTSRKGETARTVS